MIQQIADAILSISVVAGVDGSHPHHQRRKSTTRIVMAEWAADGVVGVAKSSWPSGRLIWSNQRGQVVVAERAADGVVGLAESS